MAFNITRSPKFSRVVTVAIPTEDPKRPNKGSFVAKFRYHPREKAIELGEKLKSGELTDMQMLEEIEAEFSGIGTDEGELSPREQLLAVHADTAVCRVVFEEFFSGNGEARAKN